MNKKIMIFGIVGLFAVALISAATLSYFGIWSGTFTVTEAISTEGEAIFDFNGGDYVAGESFLDCDNSVTNDANVDIPVNLLTTCKNSVSFDGSGENNGNIDWSLINGPECDGITTEIYGILVLTKKDTITWAPVEPTDTITIRYTIVGDTFEYETTDGIIPGGYELVYAMDKDDRFNDYASVVKVGDINENLPYSSDWNVDADPDYCSGNGYDNYKHCVGAKLWLVYSGDLGTPIDNVYPLSWANMADYYYETDLIVYSDDEFNEINLLANGGGFDFCVSNDLAITLEEDAYTIETSILPVLA